MRARPFTSSWTPTRTSPADSHSTPIDHAMACGNCVRGLWRRRHERVLHAFTKVLRRFGVYVTTGGINVAVGSDPGKESGHDALVFGDSKTMAVDVTVRHRSLGTHNGPATNAHGEKMRKYKEIAEKLGWVTLPVVMTTSSELLDKSMEHIKQVCATAQVPGCRNELVAALKIACVRGNADMYEITGIQPDFGEELMVWSSEDQRGDNGMFDGETDDEEDATAEPTRWKLAGDRRGIRVTPSQEDAMRGARSASTGPKKKPATRSRSSNAN